jgi:hypothetical protein
MSEEIDFENAKPVKLVHEADPAKIVKFFEGEEQTPIHPKEITEQMLADLYDNLQELDHLSKLVEMQKKDIKELGKGSENIAKGKYVACFKTVKGSKSVKWEKFCKAMIGEIKDSDLEKYTEESEPSTRLEVKKLG